MAKALTESRRTRYTRQAIQDAFIDLLRDKPLARITVSELCGAADVNRSTFYAHYDNLEELLRTIEDETFRWLSDAFDGMLERSGRDAGALDDSIVQVCRYIAQNRSHLQVLMSPRADIDFQRRLIGLIYGRYDRLMQMRPERKSALENVMHTRFAVHGSIGLIQYWLETDLKATPEEIARTIIDMGTPRDRPL